MNIKKAAALVFVMLAFLGIYLSKIAISSLINAISSPSWPTEVGIIKDRWSGGVSTGSSGEGSRIIEFCSYEFNVGNYLYTSNRVSYARSDSKCAKYLQNIKKGDLVRVFYQKKNPSECVLIPGCDYEFYIFPLISLILLFFSFAGLTLIIKRISEERKKEEKNRG